MKRVIRDLKKPKNVPDLDARGDEGENDIVAFLSSQMRDKIDNDILEGINKQLHRERFDHINNTRGRTIR